MSNLTVLSSTDSPPGQKVINVSTIVPANVVIGAPISGSGIPAGALITAATATTITINVPLSGDIPPSTTITYPGATAYVGTLASTLNVNSIKNATLAGSVTLAAPLVVDSGMILQTSPTALTFAGTSTLSSGTSPDLIFTGNGAGVVTVSASIQSTTAGPQTLTKTVNMVLSGSNNLGDIYDDGGNLNASSANALATTAASHTLYLNGGGTLQFDTVNQSYANLNIDVGVGSTTLPEVLTTDSNIVGGRQVVLGSSSTTVNLQGTLAFAQSSNAANAATNLPPNITLAGQLTGPGPIMANATALGTSRGIVTLTNNNPNWSGGIYLRDGFEVRVANAGALGTGSINSSPNSQANFGGSAGGGIGQLVFTNDIVGNTTISNDFNANLADTIVNWKTDAPLTLSGKIEGTGGLLLQGFATGGAVSETVLSGTVAVSGIPAAYSYGQTATIQNFVNGAGGITEGATGFQSAITNPLVQAPIGGGSMVDQPGNTVDTTGALGFVRFAGSASYIQGESGPGYLSAIHLGGDTAAQNEFGYLVTGTATGSTYQLPEGKSYVIGSLGAGAQVGGVLGATGTGSNTATLIGNNKIAGFGTGDVNIQANGVADTQSLSLLAKNAGDTLNLGSATQSLVFTPTFGDSGAFTSMTLLQTRTGATTLNKTGAGTVNINNAAFTKIDGTDDRSGFSFAVSAGTLDYNQTDAMGSSAFGGVSVSSGGAFGGNGVINSTVTVATGGTFAPGASGAGTLGTGNLSLNLNSTFIGTINSAGITTTNVAGTVNLDLAVAPSPG